MRLHNITRSTKITDDLKIAQKWRDKALGLLSKQNPRSLLFYTRFGIHTFGLKLPIDLLVINAKDQVVDLKEDFSPNHFFFWNPKYGIVIELPQGAISKSKTRKGDLVEIS